VNAAGRNAVVMSLMICCGFVICWTPSGIHDLLMIVIANHEVDASGWLYHFVIVMMLVSSCVNPFIYAAKYREFQAGVRRLLRHQVEPSVQQVVGGVT